MARKKSQNYVDNSRLKELVTDYIISNPNDNGEWLERYEKTMTRKHGGKNDQRLSDALDFVAFRKELYSHPRPFAVYESTCRELFPMLYKIIDGRMASYHIFDNEDIRQDCMLALLKYLNRYDFRKATSVFAYVSEVVTQAINLHLQEEKKDYLDGMLILESDLMDYVRGVDESVGAFSEEGQENV
jgi:hypothetical protein